MDAGLFVSDEADALREKMVDRPTHPDYALYLGYKMAKQGARPLEFLTEIGEA
jgi:hypothetical protein